MKFRELSKSEWHHIRTLRGNKLTGYAAHRCKRSAKLGQLVGAGKTYYWPMGQQPTPGTIDTIARKCPIDAAWAFLALYVAGTKEQRNPPTPKEQA